MKGMVLDEAPHKYLQALLSLKSLFKGASDKRTKLPAKILYLRAFLPKADVP